LKEEEWKQVTSVHPQENEWDSQTMTDVANRLGDYGFGPHAKSKG